MLLQSRTMKTSIESQISFFQTARNSVEALQALGLEFELLDDGEHEWLLIGAFDTEIGRVRVVVALRDVPNQWVVQAYHPLVIVSSMRPIASELLMRINDALIVGNWEINWDDGHMRFRIGTDFTNGFLSVEKISDFVQFALTSLLEYHTPIVRTLFDGVSPQQALDEN